MGNRIDILPPNWLAIAIKELGVSEVPGDQHNKRIVEYHATTTLKATTDEIPWCSSFVNWCINESGLIGTNMAAARSWLGWGARLSIPALGCVVVISRGTNVAQGHVGFYTGAEGSNIKILGGNQGNQVSVALFPKDRLLGYRWP